MKLRKIVGRSLFLCLIALAASGEIKAQTPPASAAAFTGTWVLDRENTNTSKDFPHKMKNYKIIVAENESTLNVKSQVDGTVEIEISRDRGSSSSSGEIVSNNVSRSSTPPPGGSISGNTLGSARAEEINYGGTMALFFTPVEANYNLTGEEVKIDLRQGDKVNGTARIKAKLAKAGNQIQFTTIRRQNTMKGDIEITVRETWKLSKDGKQMRFERTVETPTARDQIVMMLAKAA